MVSQNDLKPGQVYKGIDSGKHYVVLPDKSVVKIEEDKDDKKPGRVYDSKEFCTLRVSLLYPSESPTGTIWHNDSGSVFLKLSNGQIKWTNLWGSTGLTTEAELLSSRDYKFGSVIEVYRPGS